MGASPHGRAIYWRITLGRVGGREVGCLAASIQVLVLTMSSHSIRCLLCLWIPLCSFWCGPFRVKIRKAWCTAKPFTLKMLYVVIYLVWTGFDQELQTCCHLFALLFLPYFQLPVQCLLLCSFCHPAMWKGLNIISEWPDWEGRGWRIWASPRLEQAGGDG